MKKVVSLNSCYQIISGICFEIYFWTSSICEVKAPFLLELFRVAIVYLKYLIYTKRTWMFFHTWNYASFYLNLFYFLLEILDFGLSEYNKFLYLTLILFCRCLQLTKRIKVLNNHFHLILGMQTSLGIKLIEILFTPVLFVFKVWREYEE